MLYSIKTFGCKVNTYDTALLQKHLEEKGFKRMDKGCVSKDSPDVHIINTCAVTQQAVQEAKRWIRRQHRKHPHSSLVVTGCAAQVETEQFTQLKEVDQIIANSHKHRLAHLLPAPSSPHQRNKETTPVFKSSIFKVSNMGLGGGVESQHSRLFLKIQDGCNSFCTFCVIPFARGKSKSLPCKDLIDSVNRHYDQGVRELVLTGVHIGDYRMPESPARGLKSLVEALLKKTQMPRIRLSSLEPPELTEELLDLYHSERMCPHFHLSVQSLSSPVLKHMKRTYQARDVTKALQNIYRQHPRAFVGMDVIAGFSGEGKKEFEDTYFRLKDNPWTKIHVFPYSSRPHTYASKKLPTLPQATVVKRASLLRHLSQLRYEKAGFKQTGCVKTVLPLKYRSPAPHIRQGLSKDFWKIQWKSELPPDYTKEYQVLIHSFDSQKESLLGEPKMPSL